MKMDLPKWQEAFPREGNSGAGSTLGGGAQAGPAHPGYTVGAVGFGPHWSAEDAMAASIVRLECEKDELTARVAVLEAEQPILAQFKVLAESLAKTQVELKQERDEWRECAEGLHAAVCYLEPALLYDDCEGGFTNERAAVREFMRLKEASK